MADFKLIYYFLLQGGFEIGDATETPVETLVERSIVRGAPIMVVVPNYRLNGQFSTVSPVCIAK